ncbi:MAG: hypothetical protein QF440_00720 [Candidatus Thalassarchaeaceae archaeon]|nr:hypothetical protein [Candidatus Thalassarchaeaceae archaeon]
MDTPATTAENLFLGLGMTLLLVTAFALIDGRLPPDECPEGDTQEICTSSSEFGWIVPALAGLSLTCGIMMRFSRISGNGPLLGNLFSDEDEKTISNRLTKDYIDANDTDRITGAWANLETKMLESNYNEEE